MNGQKAPGFRPGLVCYLGALDGSKNHLGTLPGDVDAGDRYSDQQQRRANSAEINASGQGGEHRGFCVCRACCETKCCHCKNEYYIQKFTHFITPGKTRRPACTDLGTVSQILFYQRLMALMIIPMFFAINQVPSTKLKANVQAAPAAM